MTAIIVLLVVIVILLAHDDSENGDEPESPLLDALASEFIGPDNAAAGQCVDVVVDGDEVTMLLTECDDVHDAEIVGVEEVDSDNLDAIETGMADYCAQVVSEDDLATLLARDDIDLKAVIEDPSNVETGSCGGTRVLLRPVSPKDTNFTLNFCVFWV